MRGWLSLRPRRWSLRDLRGLIVSVPPPAVTAEPAAATGKRRKTRARGAAARAHRIADLPQTVGGPVGKAASGERLGGGELAGEGADTRMASIVGKAGRSTASRRSSLPPELPRTAKTGTTSPSGPSSRPARGKLVCTSDMPGDVGKDVSTSAVAVMNSKASDRKIRRPRVNNVVARSSGYQVSRRPRDCKVLSAAERPLPAGARSRHATPPPPRS